VFKKFVVSSLIAALAPRLIRMVLAKRGAAGRQYS
jgi:hypothetical protein